VHERRVWKETRLMWKVPQIFFSWEGIIACMTYRFASWNVLNLTHCLPCSKIVLNKCKYSAPHGGRYLLPCFGGLFDQKSFATNGRPLARIAGFITRY
jgi:hypothetical protein